MFIEVWVCFVWVWIVIWYCWLWVICCVGGVSWFGGCDRYFVVFYIRGKEVC